MTNNKCKYCKYCNGNDCICECHKDKMCNCEKASYKEHCLACKTIGKCLCGLKDLGGTIGTEKPQKDEVKLIKEKLIEWINKNKLGYSELIMLYAYLKVKEITTFDLGDWTDDLTDDDLYNKG